MTNTSQMENAGRGGRFSPARSRNPASKPIEARSRTTILTERLMQANVKTFNSAVQRARLLEFADALRSRVSALRRDECKDPRINGRHGHVYATPDGFLLVVFGWSARGWGNAKQALAFAKLSQDGDDEGILILDRLPTKTEAELICHYLGFAKRKELSPEQLAALTQRGFKSSKNLRSSTEGGVDRQIGP